MQFDEKKLEYLIALLTHRENDIHLLATQQFKLRLLALSVFFTVVPILVSILTISQNVSIILKNWIINREDIFVITFLLLSISYLVLALTYVTMGRYRNLASQRREKILTRMNFDKGMVDLHLDQQLDHPILSYAWSFSSALIFVVPSGLFLTFANLIATSGSLLSYIVVMVAVLDLILLFAIGYVWMNMRSRSFEFSTAEYHESRQRLSVHT